MNIPRMIVLLSFLFPSSGFAFKYSQQECTQIANHLNQTLPMQVDQQTALVSSTCSVVNDLVTFIYIYELNVKPIINLPSASKAKAIKKFCSNPDSREFLTGVSKVHMDYFLEDGVFYERIQFGEEDCY